MLNQRRSPDGLQVAAVMKKAIIVIYEERFSLLDFIPIMGKLAVLWLVWKVSISGVMG